MNDGSLGRKDLAATALTALAVLTFVAAHQGWDVPLVGSSYRWAAGVIVVLGMATCSLGSPGKYPGTRLLSVLGVTASALALIAIVTGSLTALSLLVLAYVLLWAASTFVHMQYSTRRRVAV